MLHNLPPLGNTPLRKLTFLLSFLLISLFSSAQLKTISGVVTDTAGSPLQGVSVIVQKSRVGTSTDASGHFTLLAAAGSTVTGIVPDQAVRLVGTMSVLGQKMDVSVIAVLQLAGRQIQISPRDIRVGSGAAATKLPQVVQTGLRSLFTVRIDPGTLPFAVTPTTLQAVDNGLLISGVAHDLVISSGPTTARAEN